MQKKRKSVCIIALSPVASDARVLRQIQYLSPHFDLTVIGYGDPPPRWRNHERVKWLTALSIFPDKNFKGLLTKFANRALLLTGKIFPKSYERLYWSQPAFKDALEKAVSSGCDAFHANDWNTLPFAAEASMRLNARLVFDAHEYAPVEFEEQRIWRFFIAPMITYILRKYAPQADASVTVAPAIAERYQQVFHINPLVVLNAPSQIKLSKKQTDFENLRLIYHGSAMRDRRIENIIKTLAMCDGRYSLHLMLNGHAPDYLQELKSLADALAPGRVIFHEPVTPDKIVQRISDFDMGVCYMIPDNFNYLSALPNKFFDCIAAGLPICVCPSPSMARIVKEYEMGCVAPSFEPQDIAATLNELKAEDFTRMQQGAREATKEINADKEMAKLVSLYQRLLSEEA